MKTLSRIILIAISTIVLSWALPWLYGYIFPSATSDPFVSFSPVNNRFIVSTSDGGGLEIVDIDPSTGKADKSYDKNQRDSLLPQVYFTQLLARESLPDSIDGKEVNVPTLKHSQWVFTSIPHDINAVAPRVYFMMESMPERVDLEDPKEIFREKNGGVEFIAMENNQINIDRSTRFSKAFSDNGFVFPISFANADITARKAYDEGYMLVDAEGKLFHLKQQAGRPSMTRIGLPEGMKARHAFILENPDRRHVALFTASDSNMYIIDRQDNRPYLVAKNVDASRDRITVMASLFNIIIKVSDNNQTRWIAISPDRDYDVLGVYTIPAEKTTAMKVAEYLFPMQLTFTSTSSKFARPVITSLSGKAMILNIVLGVILVLVLYRGGRSRREIAISTILTFALGIYIFIPLLILKN